MAGGRLYVVCWALLSSLLVQMTVRGEGGSQSPVNQVFQFVQTAECKAWPDGSSNRASAYLWIPESCRQVRGLLILCANVPEHRLVGHPAIRKACADNDLGIVWCVPSFMNFKKDMPKAHTTIVAFLQELLNGLATTSGYEEIASVPWLPMGESGHLLMVDALVEAKPDRCIAGIWIKNHHLPPTNRTVPALVIYGTAQEWSQDKSDVRAKWNDVEKNYKSILMMRAEHADWPLSYAMDGWSGHFDCDDRTTEYMAEYIDKAAKARMPDEMGDPLKPPLMAAGYVANLPVPGQTKSGPDLARNAQNRSLPWYFDAALATEAQTIASIDWTAQTQLPGFVDADDQIMPFDFNGIANIKSVKWEADGVTFLVRARMLDQIPQTFVGAGEPLVHTSGEPMIDWLCGPVAPLGNRRFRIALDRTYGAAATYLCARQPGSDGIRSVVQPLAIQINSLKNTAGAPQTIQFNKISDVVLGTKSVQLLAKSDSGLPVEFFVVSGPAIVRENELTFTAIPPRSRLPLSVTVAAWQWGRSTEPKVKMAEIVRQEFRMVAPSATQ